MAADEKTHELIKVLADELAEIKARAQAMNEVTLMVFNVFLEAAAGLAEQANVSFPDTNLLTDKYVQFYESYRQKYRQEIEDRLAEAAKETPIN